METSSDSNLTTGERGNAIGVWIRVAVLIGAGMLTGWLSGWSMVILDGHHEWHLRWPPGLIYALLWLMAAWCPGGLMTRERVKRSFWWSVALMFGITASYAMAFETTYYVVQLVDRSPSPVPGKWNLTIAIGGFAGGLVGSAGLVNVWALLFPGAEPWGHRTALIIWGGLLGIFLTMWDVNGDFENGLIPFFIIWQGGMAAGLGLADAAWRVRSFDIESLDRFG